MRQSIFCFLALWGSSLVACKAGETPVPQNDAPTTSAVSAAAATTVASAAPVKKTLDEGQARALLERWTQAQNAANFEQYAALYAERFTGIKRAGTRTSSFDQRSWLADRKPMFKPGLKVEVSDVELSVAAQSARVRFTQAFATGAFQDKGAKELVLSETPVGLQIVREEMLRSDVLVSNKDKAAEHIWALTGDRLHFRESVPEAALQGPPLLIEGPGAAATVAERRVDLRQLSEAQRAWVGREVVTLTASGTQCRAKVTEFVARLAGVVHFGTVQHWQGFNGEPPASPAQIAEDVWALSSVANVELVGKLTPKCDAALWATDVLVPKTVFAPQRMPAELETLLLGVFATLPAVQALQQEFEGYDPENTKPWYTVDATVNAAVFEAVNGKQTATLSINAGAGCGGFYGAHSVRFELDVSGAKPRIVKREEFPSGELAIAASAFDLDNDGSLELLLGPAGFTSAMTLWRSGPGGLSSVLLSDVGFWDCPC